MNSSHYVICDIEATGLGVQKDIIEIALITYKNDEVTERFETLVNPLRPISEEISRLTGITNRELLLAPRFDEIAEKILERLRGNTFVSHNTDFDLNLLLEKFQELGIEYKTKSYCTQKMAEQEIPGMRSYSLDALCNFFHIKNHQRHRAMGDAEAALKLFKELECLRNKKFDSRPLYLPQHESVIKKIPGRAGLLRLIGEKDRVFKQKSTRNLFKKAEELLVVERKNRENLQNTVSVSYEVTGSALIAEILDYLENPFNPKFVINSVRKNSGEMEFKIFPYRKGKTGHWYFKNYFLAEKKLKLLNNKLIDKKFFYREGGKSKEEIYEHNQKVLQLVKETEFPASDILIWGEGREKDEHSLVLIRKGRVLGFGYSKASIDEVCEAPDRYLSAFLPQDVGITLIAIEYLRVIKNLKFKTESWRTLAELQRI